MALAYDAEIEKQKKRRFKSYDLKNAVQVAVRHAAALSDVIIEDPAKTSKRAAITYFWGSNRDNYLGVYEQKTGSDLQNGA